MIVLTNQAKKVDFCGNGMQFTVNATKAYSASGSAAILKINVTTVSTGTFFILQFGDYTLQFTITTYIDDSGLQIPSGSDATHLTTYLNMNYILQKYFNISCAGNVVTITAKQTGVYFSIVFTSNSSTITQSLNHAGSDRVLQDNYKTLCDIYLEDVRNSNVFVNIATSLFNADISGNSFISPGKILSKYFNDIDLPDYDQSALKLITSTVKRYYLKLAEMYGGAVKNVVTSNTLNAVDGTISNDLFSSSFNYLDFAAGNKSYLLDPAIAKIETWTDAQQFLYFVNWINNNEITLQVKIYYTDTTISSVSKSTVNNALQGDCFIVPCGFNQLGLALLTPAKEAYKYEIWLETTGAALIGKHITYYLVPKPLYAREFWFKNQMGALEVVLCERQIHSLDIKRSELLTDYGYNTDIDIINDSFECSTGNKTMSEIEHLSEFVISKEAYILQNDVAKEIAIEAGTYTLANENEDLYTYKFKYRIMDNANVLNICSDRMICDDVRKCFD